MRLFFTLILLGLSCSASANERCLDIRATSFPPCEVGQQRFFIQGQCQKSWETESSYCASKVKPECINTGAIDLAPCDEGKQWIFVKGRCEGHLEVEHFYCADRN